MKVFVVHFKPKSEKDKPVVKTLVCKGWCSAAAYVDSECSDEVLSISVVNEDVVVL